MPVVRCPPCRVIKPGEKYVMAPSRLSVIFTFFGSAPRTPGTWRDVLDANLQCISSRCRGHSQTTTSSTVTRPNKLSRTRMLTSAVHALRRSFHEAIPWLPALIMTRVLYYLLHYLFRWA